jgi:predicted ferric reductase
MWPVWGSVLFTLALWLASKWYFDDWFADPFKYPAKAASLTAVVLMCWSVALSARFRVAEDFFGGLDKVYQVHKRLGRLAFFVIVAHPLCLGADRLPEFGAFLADIWFRFPGGSRYLHGQNVGVASFLLMAALIVLTLWLKPAYHVWKRSHEWFGAVMVLAAAHIFIVDADVAAYPLLAAWVYALLALALFSFGYIRFLYRFLGPQAEYRIERIDKVRNIIELTLAPKRRKLDFKPSQFAYLVFHKPGISPEPHPYSIASGYNLRGRLKFGIKQVGDHTRTLERLEKDDPVTVYGPYGRFSEPFLSAERDCVFIGGGIGITPFLGMWHVALHSQELLDPDMVPERLKETHPEIIKTWKSPRVSLFYVCRDRQQASFDADVRREVILSRFHDFEHIEERGHKYFLYLTSEQGRITAERVREISGDPAEKYVFLCGPNAMVNALVAQFRRLGVPRERIVVEDFNLF